MSKKDRPQPGGWHLLPFHRFFMRNNRFPAPFRSNCCYFIFYSRMSTSSKRKVDERLIALHLFACLCFIVLPFIFFPRPQDILTPFNNPQTMRDVAGQCLLIGFFYFTYYHLIPEFYTAKRYLPFAAIVILCFAVVTFLPTLLIHDSTGNSSHQQQSHRPDEPGSGAPPAADKPGDHFPPGGEPPGLPPPNSRNGAGSLSKEVNHYIFLFLVVLFFALTLRINNQWKQVRKEKTEAELSYLKAQINPHFLFNTLNSIYSLSVRRSDAAPEAIVKLAGMMRYVLQEADAEHVPLEKELTYLRDYVALQKLRFGTDVPVEFAVTGNADGKQIAPLILINFIENAFKHGVNAEEDSRISVRIEIAGNSVILTVQNNKINVHSNEPGGMGLQNVKSRLALLYPGKHQLTIENGTDTYLVVLHLRLI